MKTAKWIEMCLKMTAACALAVSVTGCRSWWPFTADHEEGLLGPRQIVPPPYRAPVPEVTREPRLQTAPPPVPLTHEPPLMETERGAIHRIEEVVELPPAVESETLSYEVQKGDTLWDIARKYGITHQELASYNKMNESDTLKVGTVLEIPPGGRPLSRHELQAQPKPPTPKSQTTGPARREAIAAGALYEVKSGDNLWLIARRSGVSVKDLKQLNNLTRDTIQPGQKLKIPAAGTTTPARQEQVPTTPQPKTTAAGPGETGIAAAGEEDTAVAPRERSGVTSSPALAYPKTMPHVVSQEDTLQIIAEIYGTTAEDIKKANPDIDSDEDLQPNMEILVPYTEE